MIPKRTETNCEPIYEEKNSIFFRMTNNLNHYNEEKKTQKLTKLHTLEKYQDWFRKIFLKTLCRRTFNIVAEPFQIVV